MRWFSLVSFLCRQFGHHAVSITVAEKYIAAFGNLAKDTNTILLPSNPGDISGMVAQVGTTEPASFW